jgi:NAD-dependent deacetylase
MSSASDDSQLRQVADWIKSAQSVAVLTGAGVSAESGVATFRDAGGLWEGHRVEEVATPMAFQRDPLLVWRFYNARRANLKSVKPNPGHHALAQLEQRLGSDRFTLVTQNVDGLHRTAGNRNVLEIHGSIARVRCTGCGEKRVTDETLADLPRCGSCQELLRPDIVWFHEMLPEDVWEKAMIAVYECSLFLVVGTSAVVYPAAGLIDVAKANKVPVVEINLNATAASERVDVSLFGPSGEVLPRLLALTAL